MAPEQQLIQSNKQRFIDELLTFLAIPSISTNSNHDEDVQTCAQYLKEHLKKIGLEQTQIIQTKKHPIVLSQYKVSEDLPTVLIYGHYDVQPPDPLDLWHSPPFEPEIRENYIYARGVSDDKGQVFCHIKAIELLLSHTGTLPVNIIFLIEGEEEIGSPNLSTFIQENKALLKADIAVISDTPMINKSQPALCFSLRGMVYAELEVIGPNKDLHSGQYGGFIVNPIQALASMISRLKDTQDRVLIPHFYDDVLAPNTQEKEAINKVPNQEKIIKEALNCHHFSGDPDLSIAEKQCLHPTLDCNGIVGGYIEKGAKTIIPSKASTKISMRLVANQNPDSIAENLSEYLHDIKPDGVRINIHIHTKAHPAKMDMNNAYIQAAKKAFSEVYNTEPLWIGEGGTIPVVSDFKQLLDLETVMMGFNCPDDGIHSPNERLLVDGFIKGIQASLKFLEHAGKNT